MKRGMLARASVAMALLSCSTLWLQTPVDASDHNEPQSINAISPIVDPRGSIADPDASDIYGNFVFPTQQSVVFIITFPGTPFGFGYQHGAPPELPYDESHPHAYDPGVLYTIHIDPESEGLFDSDANLISRNAVRSEHQIHARFGYDPAAREWGIQVSGIPGEDDAITGPVGQTLFGQQMGGSEPRALVRAGLFDEPFFFDLERFLEGQRTENLRFRPDVDFFAGRNVRAIVIEVPKDRVASKFWGLVDRPILSVWVETHRRSDDPRLAQNPASDICEVELEEVLQ